MCFLEWIGKKKEAAKLMTASINTENPFFAPLFKTVFH